MYCMVWHAEPEHTITCRMKFRGETLTLTGMSGPFNQFLGEHPREGADQFTQITHQGQSQTDYLQGQGGREREPKRLAVCD